MKFLKIFIYFLIIFFIFGDNLYSCGPEINREPIEEITIFCPENMVSSIMKMRPVFEKNFPGHTIYAPESSDLENIYDIIHFNKTPDILILSDESLLEKFLFSYIDWYIIFASDRIVLAFTENSKYSSKIDENNWYKIIARGDVKPARMNERISTLGYRTLMALNLAENYYRQDFDNLYRNFLHQNVFSSEKELNFLLLANDLDYIFDYLSAAKRYKFRYITLPAQIDLSSKEFKEDYAQAEITLGDNILTGRPIRYLITIPNNVTYPQRGLKFLRVMFGKQGKEILKNHKIQIAGPYLQIINKTSGVLEDVEEILRGAKNE